MEIIIADIPVEGLYLEGDMPESIFELEPQDSIRSKGKLHYAATIYSFDEAIVFSGKLNSTFDLQCGICLEFFEYKADIPNWSSELDVEERQYSFDLKEAIREDFLLRLPSHARCDVEGNRDICPKTDIMIEADHQEPMEETEQPADDMWGELDKLK